MKTQKLVNLRETFNLNSPALYLAKQGLQVGDRIVEIDSEPTYGMPELSK